MTAGAYPPTTCRVFRWLVPVLATLSILAFIVGMSSLLIARQRGSGFVGTWGATLGDDECRVFLRISKVGLCGFRIEMEGWGPANAELVNNNHALTWNVFTSDNKRYVLRLDYLDISDRLILRGPNPWGFGDITFYRVR